MASEKVMLLREAMKRIREWTFDTYDERQHKLDWAKIQAEAARALRDTE